MKNQMEIFFINNIFINNIFKNSILSFLIVISSIILSKSSLVFLNNSNLVSFNLVNSFSN